VNDDTLKRSHSTTRIATIKTIPCHFYYITIITDAAKTISGMLFTYIMLGCFLLFSRKHQIGNYINNIHNIKSKLYSSPPLHQAWISLTLCVKYSSTTLGIFTYKLNFMSLVQSFAYKILILNLIKFNSNCLQEKLNQICSGFN
jgi:hypothetical protein